MPSPSSLPSPSLEIPGVIAGFVAVLVGYTSSAAIIFQAATAAGASTQQISGWFCTLGIAMGMTTLGFSLYYRMPVLTAWSTPGAALLATSFSGSSVNEAIGVFIFTNALIFLCGITGLFARLMSKIPPTLAAAMLAGILLRFGLDVFSAFALNFTLCGGMCLVYLGCRRYCTRYAIVLTLFSGWGIAALQGTIHLRLQAITFALPQWIPPHFTFATLLGVGVPYFLVTMASQNAPGIATLQAHGYHPPVSSLMSWTGLVALLLSPLGGFSVCVAAITAAICMGDDVHSDPRRRYLASAIAGIGYLLAGVFGAVVGLLLTALPAVFIHTLAGLALLTTLSGSIQRALSDRSQQDAALITFLITASGVSLLGIGAAFWGLIGGVLVQLIFSLPERGGTR